ncbi:probable E3 ubiquitin-protein ligase ZFP1 [Vigna angularis]|uniref:probable E3 ubiquitin-protein ligase ZFP1 n=1 Tax=Phaseolus angularis TaxID=3914 RepID=UPI000809B646|nr:probable E3 ubiquitin-protein ligase ZFP1 [Vigna angularis]
MSENIHTMVIRGMTIDSNYLVDVDENGMIYGITQHHRLHHQPSYSNNFVWGHYSALVWNFLSYMLMNTDDMSYETLYNVQEFPSLGDPHSDMRLDIDGMSYEELLELSEWMNDNSEKGLSEDIIARHMQTKSYLLSENLGDQESDICIICQDEYKNKEEIGILQCGHEYHGECIKRWLHEKNVCPMCKSKGLTIE